MKDLIIKLRQQLVSMVEEIDNYIIPLNDTIFIKKEDLKWIKYLGKLNSYLHEFEYKNEVRFKLGNSSTYPLEQTVFLKLINGTLESIILNKFSYKAHDSEEQIIYYKLEDPIKTKLRNLYNPQDEESEEDNKNLK